MNSNFRRATKSGINFVFLLDTNVLSELMDGGDGAKEVLDWKSGIDENTFFISAVTVGEILYGVALMNDGKKKNAKAAMATKILSMYINRGKCLPFDANVALHYGDIRAARKKSGRSFAREDVMIAAVALANKCAVVTRDEKGFVGIEYLRVVNPWRKSSPAA